MTRINTIHPRFLTDQHLRAEIRELPRIFTAVKRGHLKGTQPASYTMGAGHVTFFRDKLHWLAQRYTGLVEEAECRNMTMNVVVDVSEYNGSIEWQPSTIDKRICIDRIAERYAANGGKSVDKAMFYKYYGCDCNGELFTQLCKFAEQEI